MIRIISSKIVITSIKPAKDVSTIKNITATNSGGGTPFSAKLKLYSVRLWGETQMAAGGNMDLV
ncbi:hypothetical protein FRC18_007007 [Serendipita sp. 400]|nr:hypothetical protein FRC18_007007 [Serendipita sp. 400]